LSESSRSSRRRGGNFFQQAFGDDRHAVSAIPQGPPLEDGPFEDIADRFQVNSSVKFFRDDAEGCAGSLADAEGEVARGAAHDDDEIPAARGSRILHQVLHQLETELARGLETERGKLARQRQVVIDGFRHVTDADLPRCLLGDLARRKHRIVAADRRQVAYTQAVEGCDDPLNIFCLLCRVGARRIENRATLESRRKCR